MNTIEELGIAKLLHTTNPKFKKYEGKSGGLGKIGNLDKYLYYFDMIKYFLRTSLVKKVEYEDCNTQKCKMIVTTLHSVYQFEISFSKKYLSLEEVLENVDDIKEVEK